MSDDTVSRIHKDLDEAVRDLQRELKEKGLEVSYVEASKHLAKMYSIEARRRYVNLAEEIVKMWK